MELPIIPTALIAIVLIGHVIQIVWDRDDWPLSNYAMYSYLVSDQKHNPFVPLSAKHKSEAGFLVLVLTMEDGSTKLLTDGFNHLLLTPFDRLRIIRQLTATYKRGGDLSIQMKSIAAWVQQRNQESGSRLPIKSLDLQLYLWRQVPANPGKHAPPDEVVAITSEAL